MGIKEKRVITNSYVELVFYNKEMDKWNKIFVDFFGPALKPLGMKPSAEALRLTKEFGGIYEDQILFRKNFKGDTAIAMFWPWQDTIHATLKMALLKNSSLWERVRKWSI